MAPSVALVSSFYVPLPVSRAPRCELQAVWPSSEFDTERGPDRRLSQPEQFGVATPHMQNREFQYGTTDLGRQRRQRRWLAIAAGIIRPFDGWRVAADRHADAVTSCLSLP